MKEENREETSVSESEMNGIEEFQEDYFKDPFMPSPEERNNSQKNIYSHIFLFQIIICVALFAGLGSLRFMLPDFYREIQLELATVQQGVSVHDGINQGISQVQDFIENLKPLGSSSEAESQSESQNSTSNEAVPEGCSLEAPAYDGETVRPLEGEVTSKYGFRINPVSGENEFHRGVDIAAEENTAIVSIGDGVVESAGYDESYGNYVKITHTNGFSSIYAHCNELLVQQGQSVAKGTTIATVGGSGEATGPHLHFGIQKDGVYINPAGTFAEYQ